MYCRRCFADLRSHQNLAECPKCNLPFDAQNRATYLLGPRLSNGEIIRQVIFTSIVALFVAFVVGMFQLAAASGH